MIGVVLWSDKSARKAIVWCEDHGDLAYYTSASQLDEEPTPLDVGDVVQFELLEEGLMRHVREPRLLSEEEYPAIARTLGGSDARRETPRVTPAIARWQALLQLPESPPSSSVASFPPSRMPARMRTRHPA